MTVQTNFFAISNNTDTGSVTAVTAAAASVTVTSAGIYKIAAMGQPILWKLGSTNVTTSTGSYLAAGDQEIILVDTANTKLSFIRSPDATADTKINLVPMQIFEVPGRDMRNYT